MALEIVRADSGADAIIWLILAAFWAIAQAIAKFKKGDSPRKPPPIITGDQSIEEDLKKFFEQLSGQQQEPPPAPPPPPPPLHRPMRPVPYGMSQRSSQPPPKYKTASKKSSAPAPVRLPPATAPVFASEAVDAKILVGHDLRSVAISRGRMGGFKESTFSFKAIKTPLPSMRLPAVHMEGTGGHLRQLVQGPNNLKRAIISRVVLDSPKAFSI